MYSLLVNRLCLSQVTHDFSHKRRLIAINEIIRKITQGIMFDEISDINQGQFTVDQEPAFELKEVEEYLGFKSVDFDGVACESDGATRFSESFAHKCKELIFCSVVCSADKFARNFLPVILFDFVQSEQFDILIHRPFFTRHVGSQLLDPSDEATVRGIVSQIYGSRIL